MISNVFHDTTASQSKKRHHSSTMTRHRLRKVCRVLGGCMVGCGSPPLVEVPAPGVVCSVFIRMRSDCSKGLVAQISGGALLPPARPDTMCAGRDEMR